MAENSIFIYLKKIFNFQFKLFLSLKRNKLFYSKKEAVRIKMKCLELTQANISFQKTSCELY